MNISFYKNLLVQAKYMNIQNFIRKNSKRMNSAISFLKWLLIDFSGMRAIWYKIRPPLEPEIIKRKPSTFLLWLIAVYAAFFGLASQRYESSVDFIKNRTNLIINQLSTEKNKSALNKISYLQNMTCPEKPDLKNPISIFNSLLVDKIYFANVEFLRDIIEDWKDELDGVDLKLAHLQNARLREANLQYAILESAILQSADLGKANLQGANLKKANLQETWLVGANLQNANLETANLRSANLKEAQFQGANIDGASLQRADLSNANLKNGKLRKTYLQHSIFVQAELQGADFEMADLRQVIFYESNLQSARLAYANLEGSNLRKVNLQNANILKANIKDTIFDEADLRGIKELQAEDLCSSKSAYEAQLDLEIKEQILNICPDKLINSKGVVINQ